MNAVRSALCTTVVSTQAARQRADTDVAEAISLVEAQERLQSLDASSLSFGAGRLPKRPKLHEIEAADDAFVNVFIEITPDRKATRDDVADPDGPFVRAVRDVIEQSMGKEKSVRGTVVRRSNMLAATVPVSTLSTLENDPAIGFVSVSEPLKLDVPQATPKPRKPKSRKVAKRKLHQDGKNVIIGIIDVGGFDFAHPDFVDAKGQTRFLSIWDQGGDFRDPPERFGYGAEFTHAHLNAAIKASKAKDGFPATELERQSQQRDGSHGTHVASIAAGGQGVCPSAEIAAVLVDIPTSDDDRERRRFTFSDTSRVAHAVEYLLDIAKERGNPISINISLGTNGGAHDGSSGVSRWLDQALTTPGRAICVAAGNAGQEAGTHETDIGWTMGRIHTSGRIPSRGLDVEIEWTVVGNGIADISENELEIWYSPQDRFIASVKPPGEDKWYEAKPREFRENERLASGTTLSIYNELYHKNNGANYIAIYLSPNLDPANVRGVASGVWKVRLRGEEVRDGRFHAWIERDDPVEIGRTAGERFFRFPSFFSSRSNVDSHSISSLACGQNVIAVANVDTEAGRVNVTSSQGPTRPKPDITAAGTDIVAARGFSLDGKEWISMTGTSMASPYVTGVIGLMLSANPDLTSAQCAGILQRTTQPLPGVSFEWQNDTGFGHIDAAAAVKEAATFTVRSERR